MFDFMNNKTRNNTQTKGSNSMFKCSLWNISIFDLLFHWGKRWYLFKMHEAFLEKKLHRVSKSLMNWKYMEKSFGWLAFKDAYIICLSNVLIMNVHDAGYTRNASCAIKLYIYVFIIIAIRLWKYTNNMHDTKQL